MKNLILVSLFGKFKTFLECNGKFEEFNESKDSKCYSIVKFNGPDGVTIMPDEIPYSKGNRVLDDISFSFGSPVIPMMDIGIRLAQMLGKKIDAVYFISERTNSNSYDAFIKAVFKNVLKRDIYKGTIGFFEVMYSIGMIYSIKEKKSIQLLSPIVGFITKPNNKGTTIDTDLAAGIILAELFSDKGLLTEFKKRFSNYLTLFSDDKNLVILRGMYLAGYYGYIYESKEDDIVNIYQDRRITLPFKEIKEFIDEVHIPHYKNLFKENEIVYCVNIPGFKEMLKGINLSDRFVFSQEDFMLYAKMLLDFNNDISIKAYRLKSSDFICIFDRSFYGRKSSEFFDKQTKFVIKAFKDNQKKE